MNVIRNIKNNTITVDELYEELLVLSNRFYKSGIRIPADCKRECAGCRLNNLVLIDDTREESPICTVIRDVLIDIQNRKRR